MVDQLKLAAFEVIDDESLSAEEKIEELLDIGFDMEEIATLALER